jgi:hypothetical protein
VQGFWYPDHDFLAYEFDKNTSKPLWIKDLEAVQQSLNIGGHPKYSQIKFSTQQVIFLQKVTKNS